jgi:hypothetical protein
MRLTVPLRSSVPNVICQDNSAAPASAPAVMSTEHAPDVKSSGMVFEQVHAKATRLAAPVIAQVGIASA